MTNDEEIREVDLKRGIVQKTSAEVDMSSEQQFDENDDYNICQLLTSSSHSENDMVPVDCYTSDLCKPLTANTCHLPLTADSGLTELPESIV